MNGSFVYLSSVVPAVEIYPDALRLTLCSFFARILNNRYRVSSLSFFCCLSTIAYYFDILCKNNFLKYKIETSVKITNLVIILI